MLKSIFGGIAGRIIIGVVILGAVSGYYALTQDKTEKDIQDKLPKVGECYLMSGSENDAKIKELDCDDDKAKHRAVAIIGDDDKKTCDDFYAYSWLESSVSNNGVDVKSTVCGVPNLSVGDCLDSETVEPTPCNDTPGQGKVTKFIDVKSQEEALDEKAMTAACAGPDWMPFVVEKKVACLSIAG